MCRRPPGSRGGCSTYGSCLPSARSSARNPTRGNYSQIRQVFHGWGSRENFSLGPRTSGRDAFHKTLECHWGPLSPQEVTLEEEEPKPGFWGQMFRFCLFWRFLPCVWRGSRVPSPGGGKECGSCSGFPPSSFWLRSYLCHWEAGMPRLVFCMKYLISSNSIWFLARRNPLFITSAVLAFFFPVLNRLSLCHSEMIEVVLCWFKGPSFTTEIQMSVVPGIPIKKILVVK